MSGGVAHADPGFALVESQVRAGDAVHFSITGAKGHVSYEIEVAGRDLLKGSGDGGVVAGQFTMPDLGAGAKSVKLEADIEDSDDKTEVRRTLQYLGLALPVPSPEPARAPEPQPAAAAPQQTVGAAPAPSSGPAPVAGPVTRRAVVKHRSQRRSRKHARKHARKRRKPVRQRAALRRSGGQPVKAPAKPKRRARGEAPRTAPLFDGVPEPGSENYVPDDQVHARPKQAPAHKPVFGGAVANRSGSEPAMAIFVPGVLGLVGFALAGTAVVRRRRTR